jgi:hypothetical protein
MHRNNAPLPLISQVNRHYIAQLPSTQGAKVAASQVRKTLLKKVSGTFFKYLFAIPFLSIRDPIAGV